MRFGLKLDLPTKKPTMKTVLNITNVLMVIILSVLLGIDALGQKVRKLKGLKIDSIGTFLDSSYLRLPGYQFPLAVKVITNGKVFYTRGLGGGYINWNNFNIEVKGGNFAFGKIHISPKLFPGDYIEVIVKSKNNPGIGASQIIRLNYLQKFNIFPLGTFQKIPGERFSFGFKMNYDNGCQESVTSWNQNYKLFNSLKLEFMSVGGEVKNNRFQISSDFEDIPGHKAYMICSTPRNHFAADSMGVLLDYRGLFSFYQDAPDGADGQSGCNGADGANGSESVNGGDGGDGSCGEPGYPGEPGYYLEVFCDAYFDSVLHTDLLYVEVKNPELQLMRKYLVNPDGGSITIVSRGGDGGDGGRGGDGGNGGRGGDGKKRIIEIRDTSGVKTIITQENGCKGGNGGNGGHGGCGGYGGPGGRIDVFYTLTAQKYLNSISVISSGGSSGMSGSGGRGGSGGSGGYPNGSSGSGGSFGSSGMNSFTGNTDRVNYKLVEN